MKARNKLVFLCLIVLALLLGSTSLILGQKQLSMTYNPMPFNLPSMVEREGQMLKELGVDVSYNTFLAGYTMTEAMTARQLDIATVMGGTSAITSKAGDRDIQVIGAYSQAPKGFALVGLPDGLRLDQLAGKRISVPIGTEAHYLLGKILAEQGLSFADITVINMLVPDGVAALQTKQVDGAMVVEPVLTRLVHAGQAEVIRDGQDLIAGLTVSVARQGLDQDIIDLFKAGQAQALCFIAEYPDLALEIAARETGLPMALIEQIAPKYQFHTDITPEIKASLTDAIDFLYMEGIIRRKIDVEDLF